MKNFETENEKKVSESSIYLAFPNNQNLNARNNIDELWKITFPFQTINVDERKNPVGTENDKLNNR